MEDNQDSAPQYQPFTPDSAASPTPPPSVSTPPLAPVPTPSWSPQPPAAAPAPPTPQVVAPKNVPTSFSLAATPVTSPAAPLLSQQPVVTGGSKRSQKPLLFVGITAGIVLLAAGAVFGLYLPNTPDGVYSASLSNTAHGIDDLINYSKTVNTAQYKSTSVDGSLSLKSASGSFDTTLTGAADDNGNASVGFNTDILGQKGSAAIRIVRSGSSSTPDLYVQVSGISRALSSAGLHALSGLDGQWISIDHTLLDTYAAQLKAQGSSSAGDLKTPSYSQVNDAAGRIQAVNRQYLFTTNSATAVLTNDTFIGTEKVAGRSANHYRVGYNKAHLEAYVDALKKAVDASTLNTWSKQTNNKNLSEVLDLATMRQQVADAKNNYTFDLWADTQMKVVSKLRFVDPSDSTSVFTLSQLPKGNGEYPLTLSLTQGAGSDAQSADVTLTINTTTNKLSLGADVKTASTTFTAALTATPSNTVVHVTPPVGAKSITDILSGLGLGGALAPSSDVSPFSFGT